MESASLVSTDPHHQQPGLVLQPSGGSAMEMASWIKQVASSVGFDLVGIAPVEEIRHAEYLREWVAAGAYGQMDYLARTVDGRINLRSVLPWAQSVVCVAMSYYAPAPAQAGNNYLPPAESASISGKIARYAWGRDYHRVLYGRLRQLERLVRRGTDQAFDSRIYVDTGPCMERDLAVRAGLGWMGKNTLLIHPRHGSWFVLGEMVTSLRLPPDQPQLDRCGSCTRCIDACPTDALKPYQLDAIRCISYQTLENRGEVPSQLHEPMRQAGFLAGCDICQEVCPFNRRPMAATVDDFKPYAPAPAVNAHAAWQWTSADWDEKTRGRAFRRTKLEMWRRNSAILLGAGSSNGQDCDYLDRLPGKHN